MLTTILAGGFVLGVVVLIHEFGHFIVAKKAGIFVKTFSVGFGKKILRKRIGETEYALSILPFGGYVKFAGGEYDGEVEEERLDGAERGANDEIPDSEIPRDRYYTAQAPWKRAAVLFAGPFMNYALAVVLYIGIVYVQGVQVLPTTQIGKVTAGGAADSVGMEVGDVIVAIDGKPALDWSDVEAPFIKDPESIKTFRIKRGDREFEVDFAARVESDGIRLGFAPFVPAVIGRVQKSKPAHAAGLRPGSSILAINDTTTATYDDVRRIVNAHPGVPLEVRWEQNGEVFTDSITPESKRVLKEGSTGEFTTIGLIGIIPRYAQKRESFFEAVNSGFSTAHHIIVQIVSYLGKLLTGEMGVKTLGGPILITQTAGDVANWGFDSLLLFLAFFNINLCIFNLLPILPFDGGHLSILGIEGIMRRPISPRLRGWAMQGGFLMIIALMVFVVLLDLSRCSGVGSF